MKSLQLFYPLFPSGNFLPPSPYAVCSWLAVSVKPSSGNRLHKRSRVVARRGKMWAVLCRKHRRSRNQLRDVILDNFNITSVCWVQIKHDKISFVKRCSLLGCQIVLGFSHGCVENVYKRVENKCTIWQHGTQRSHNGDSVSGGEVLFFRTCSVGRHTRLVHDRPLVEDLHLR